MKYRQKMKPKASQKLFSRTASKVNRRNAMTGYNMRGGIRL